MEILRLFAVSTVLAAGASAQITNIEAKGNLKSFRATKCARSLSNKCTPADLLNDVAQLIEVGKYRSALFPYTLAFAYGVFDQERVADESAHDAVRVLQMRVDDEVGDAKAGRFKKALRAYVDDASAQVKACAELRRIGKPDYAPIYMIQHGMGAFTGQATPDGLVGGFDAAKTWRKILADNMDCSVSGARRTSGEALGHPEEKAAQDSLNSGRSAIAIYYGDWEGVYPRDLKSLSDTKDHFPGYAPKIPVLKLPGLPEISSVEYYDDDVCSGTDGAELNPAKLRGTGKWGYVRPRPNADAASNRGCVGYFFIDSKRTDSKGKPWFLY
ncbi:MAG: hypothetical protein HKL90_06090 [Elusimicrobia bacterium]|nr:hypothetical protein [Elusimicrobiota bacterium]